MADLAIRNEKGQYLPGHGNSTGRPKRDLTDLLDRFGSLLDENRSKEAGKPVTKAEAIILRLLDELSDPNKKLSPQLVAIFLDRYFGPVTQTHLNASVGNIEELDSYKQFLEWRKSRQENNNNE
jgi:hypothetical protein